MSILTNCTLIWCANTGKANLWTSIKLWQLSQKKLLYLINMRLGYQTHIIIKFDHNVTAKKKRATWLTLFFLQKLSAGALAILLLRSFMVASKKRHTVGHGEMWMIYNLYSKLSPGWCKKTQQMLSCVKFLFRDVLHSNKTGMFKVTPEQYEKFA